MALITELHRADDLPGAAVDDHPAPDPTTRPVGPKSRRITLPALPGLAPRQLDLLDLQDQITQDTAAAETLDSPTGAAAALRRQLAEQEPYAGLSFGWYFPAQRRCAHYARRWFGDLLRATWPDQDAVDACELAFGEVVANAVVHGAGGAVRVEVRLDERACCFEITDGEREMAFGAAGGAEQEADAAVRPRAAASGSGGPAGPADAPAYSKPDSSCTVMPRRAGCLDESGRGLEMLGLLCDRWSVRAAAHGRGKTVSVVASSVSPHAAETSVASGPPRAAR